MQFLRKADDRGRGEHGWLTSRHTFSFAHYYAPQFMGFGSLRVINEDRVSPGGGFGEHPHRNMEILSYVVDGALEHRDSMGNGSIIRPGEVQRMSAGTGVMHSESNPSLESDVHFLQIWVVPEHSGLPPSYEQKMFGEDRRNRLCVVASPDGRDGSVSVHQDVLLYASLLDQGRTLTYAPLPDRMQWLQLITGRLRVGQMEMGAGDGLALSPEGSPGFVAPVHLEAISDAHLLLFDLRHSGV